jgi:hypothetical protein
VRDCQTASPEDLEARLKELSDATMRFACINYLEAVVDRVPDAMRYLSEATGPAAPFERRPSRSRLIGPTLHASDRPRVLSG